MKALKVQGISRDSLPYKAPFQPYGSYFALIVTGVITFFKGFDTFMPFTTDTFITSYIAIPTFFVLWAVYKIKFKTRIIDPQHIDLTTGLDTIDEEEKRYLAGQAALGPRTRWQKLWDAL